MSEKRIIPPNWEIKIKWNVRLFKAVNSRRSPYLDKFYRYFFRLGKSYTLPLFLPVFFIYGKWEALIHLTTSLLLTGIIMPVIKYTFRHQRPSKLLDDVYLLEPVGFKSFPSADAAYAFTLFSVMLFYGSWWIILIMLVYALLIGYGRVYMGAHFPLDVIVGSFIGLSAGICGYFLLAPVESILLDIFSNFQH
ncbi:phosphatase PAP2 family protein [Persephonella sp.]|uniref:phosphatase PAP2 family protein n=1 Tax=Persephonella sp. TaxID=2060922 RepID=UPI0025E5CEDF|nr:phosphatase PAP2 family protein [Persephonella sp.]